MHLESTKRCQLRLYNNTRHVKGEGVDGRKKPYLNRCVALNLCLKGLVGDRSRMSKADGGGRIIRR